MISWCRSFCLSVCLQNHMDLSRGHIRALQEGDLSTPKGIEACINASEALLQCMSLALRPGAPITAPLSVSCCLSPPPLLSVSSPPAVCLSPPLCCLSSLPKHQWLRLWLWLWNLADAFVQSEIILTCYLCLLKMASRRARQAGCGEAATDAVQWAEGHFRPAPHQPPQQRVRPPGICPHSYHLLTWAVPFSCPVHLAPTHWHSVWREGYMLHDRSCAPSCHQCWPPPVSHPGNSTVFDQCQCSGALKRGECGLVLRCKYVNICRLMFLFISCLSFCLLFFLAVFPLYPESDWSLVSCSCVWLAALPRSVTPSFWFPHPSLHVTWMDTTATLPSGLLWDRQDGLSGFPAGC